MFLLTKKYALFKHAKSLAKENPSEESLSNLFYLIPGEWQNGGKLVKL
jgi:hypothetical protein